MSALPDCEPAEGALPCGWYFRGLEAVVPIRRVLRYADTRAIWEGCNPRPGKPGKSDGRF
jgi:hypothetical protein